MWVSKISGLKRTFEVIKHRSGSDSDMVRKSPGKTTFESITLERGITHDSEFEKQANKVWKYSKAHNTQDLGDFRKDVIVEVCDEKEI